MCFVGVTCGRQCEDFMLSAAYLKALNDVGLHGVILPPQTGDFVLPEGISGIVLSGGGDPHPLLWNEEPHSDLGEVDAVRDLWEIALCRAALAADLPLLGICRGMQVLNVALAGTLWQNLQERGGNVSHWQTADMACGWHNVVCRGKLSEIYGEAPAKMRVNSHHHQGIRLLGEGLRACAYAMDGLIEGIELTERRFALGVQWHPERLAAGRKLLASFAAACAL